MSFRFYIKNFGCKVNQWEGEWIAETLVHLGAERARHWGDADCAIVNGCTVTGRSESKVKSFLRRITQDQAADRVVLTGCGANEIAREKEWRTLRVCDQSEKDNLPSRVWAWMEDADPTGSWPAHPAPRFMDRTRAWVKVQDGCDAMCAYCRVPLARPEMRSRAERDILKELERLDKAGKKEIVLAGIRLAAYGKDRSGGCGLADLVRKSEKVFGGRIRLSSLEPMDLDRKTLDSLLNVDRLCQHLHLPVQSGDDNVLRTMKRRYTVQTVIDLIDRARERWPNLGFTTDMIAGFPGETEQAHQASLNLIARLMPHRVHVFPFSSRRGTSAATMNGMLPMSRRSDRAEDLRNQARQIGYQWMSERIGNEVEVLWEVRKKERWVGRTSQDVLVSSRSDPGSAWTLEKVTGVDVEKMWNVR